MSSEHEPLDDPDPPTSAVQTKKKEPTQKKIWMLTYCPAGTYITMDMLKAHDILADECHSTSDRVMNYTYIHLTKRCRITLIEKFLLKAREDYGIVKNEVFGYESIGSRSTDPGSTKMEDHIVFKMLLAHSKEKNPSFSPCTDGESNLKRGHLFEAYNAIEDSATLETRSKTQVIKYARKLEVELKMNKDKHLESVLNTTRLYLQASEGERRLQSENTALRDENISLRDENTTLKRKIQELERTLL